MGTNMNLQFTVDLGLGWTNRWRS